MVSAMMVAAALAVGTGGQPAPMIGPMKFMALGDQVKVTFDNIEVTASGIEFNPATGIVTLESQGNKPVNYIETFPSGAKPRTTVCSKVVIYPLIGVIRMTPFP